MLGVTAVLAVAAVFLFFQWKSASDYGGQKPAEPFRIAGNLYYVGANDVTSFLLTGPEGHVLIDGGYPGTAPMILKNIAKLGFDIRDVNLLLNSEPHFNHAGGLAALQKASGPSSGQATSAPTSSPPVETRAQIPLFLLIHKAEVRFRKLLAEQQQGRR